MWYGACMSMIFTSINTLTVGDLSQEQGGVGSTVLSIVQQVGIGFGIAVASIILTLYRQFIGNERRSITTCFQLHVSDHFCFCDRISLDIELFAQNRRGSFAEKTLILNTLV